MTLLLVRHADAGDRAAWTGDDTARPLSATGRSQSQALVDHLAAEPVASILSSPARRCIDTVEPIAQARGLHVEVDDALAEGTPLDVADRLLRRLRSSDVLLCSHGDVLGAIITSLRRRGAISDRPRWPKGSTWILEGWPDPGRLEYLAPPEVD